MKRFNTEIIGATVALAGLGIATLGQKMLAEDSESTMGQFLVAIGGASEYIGTFAALIPSLGPMLMQAITFIGGAFMSLLPPLIAGATALWGFISPLLVAAAPFIAIGLAVAAVGAVLWSFRDEIIGFGKKLWDIITYPFVAFKKWLASTFIGKIGRAHV